MNLKKLWKMSDATMITIFAALIGISTCMVNRIFSVFGIFYAIVISGLFGGFCYSLGQTKALNIAKAMLKEYKDKMEAEMTELLISLLRIKPKTEESETIKKAYALLDEVNAITNEQMNLIGSLDGPSKGAAFSRHRNDVYEYIKELETKKIAKFNEVLALGLDPEVTVFIDGKEAKQKLSEAIKQYDVLSEEAPKINAKPKLSVVKPTEVKE